MSRNKIIVIGAGVAGLAAGCYARMNDFDVDIFESHILPGGVCTSWTRKGFIFDYCIHNLGGTSHKSDIHMVWEELGALKNTEILNHKSFVRIEDSSGQALEWYADIDRLAAHLRTIAPEDRRVIDEMISIISRFRRVDFYALSLGGFKRMLKMIPHLGSVNRWGNVKMGEFGLKFTNPFLKRAFNHFMYDIPGEEVPMMAVIMFTAGLAAGDLGWPVGGSLAFSRRIENRLNSLGGHVRYASRVEKILVEKDTAVGVRLADGSEYPADIIVSAADGFSTIYRLLEGRYVNDIIKRYYDYCAESEPFGLNIFLGLSGEFSGTPHSLTLLLDDKIDLGNILQDSIHINFFGPETGLAPKGKSVLKIEGQARYDYWKNRRDLDVHAYKKEKLRIAEMVIDRISSRFPGLKDKIEVMDVSTPATAERFTGNRCGWQPGPPLEKAKKIMRHGLSKTLPGLRGFHHIGHWSDSTIGISSVAVSARNLIKHLCKKSNRKFQRSVAV